MAARSGPSKVNFFLAGPARPINFSNLSARSGPAHDIRSEAHERRPPYGPTRGFEEPAHAPVHGLAHMLPRSKKAKFVVFLFFHIGFIGE